jgi:uncharacterized membrane protein YphA (DoxX/SURF4 family)
MLVLLRVAIGWQFLYEGIWKLETQQTTRPWSAEGYLAQARGPLRQSFRRIVPDPDGLERLDYGLVLANWKSWLAGFEARYTPSEEQKRKLAELLEGSQEFRAPLQELPPGVDLSAFKPSARYKAGEKASVRYDQKRKQLVVNFHLLPEERTALLGLADARVSAEPADDSGTISSDEALSARTAPFAEQASWREAVERLYERSTKLSLAERLQVLLKEDTERVGQVLKQQEGTSDHVRPGKKQEYLRLLARYETELASARQDYHHEHLANVQQKLAALKAELVGPVDALTEELRAGAYKLLTIDQNAKGPLPEPFTQLRQVNLLTMWSLTILGLCLMVGLFSRVSALAAAALLFLFYLPMPPWPGVPQQPGPEHSLIVNKNLIECLTCLMLATLPTGRWVGLDALIRRLISGKAS